MRTLKKEVGNRPKTNGTQGGFCCPEERQGIVFIIMTDYTEVNTAVESMKLGSLDYIPKRLVEDKLVPLLRSILKERNIGRSRMPVFSRNSPAFQTIRKRIRPVAPTDMSVMIFGENGTGREHIAHHLHDKSKRSGKPFAAVDCGSLSAELAPSAFFGHVKGAFTGAGCTKERLFPRNGGWHFVSGRGWQPRSGNPTDVTPCHTGAEVSPDR